MLKGTYVSLHKSQYLAAQVSTSILTQIIEQCSHIIPNWHIVWQIICSLNALFIFHTNINSYTKTLTQTHNYTSITFGWDHVWSDMQMKLTWTKLEVNGVVMTFLWPRRCSDHYDVVCPLPGNALNAQSLLHLPVKTSNNDEAHNEEYSTVEIDFSWFCRKMSIRLRTTKT
jgi:hypothetical protein